MPDCSPTHLHTISPCGERGQEDHIVTKPGIVHLCNLDTPLVSDVDPLMFEGSRTYGISEVQTGQDFKA